jgi:hypothetical protein
VCQPFDLSRWVVDLFPEDSELSDGQHGDDLDWSHLDEKTGPLKPVKPDQETSCYFLLTGLPTDG